MINLHAIKSSFSFYFGADTYYRIHSPFLFELIENTLEDNRHYYIFDKIEELRKQLLNDKSLIRVEDLGAGSKSNNENLRSVNSIASTAVSPAYQGRFLFKLAQFLNSMSIIELGTSLGITSLYLASYSKKVSLTSLEGSSQILEKAKSNFQALKADNIKTVLGNFDDTFPQILKQHKKVDFIYIDGNHAKDPTLKYFDWCLPYVHDKSVIVFDDIYWSKEMTEAWEIIRTHPSVKLSLDMYYFGIVFFNKDILKQQEFKVLLSSIKPWQRYI